MASSGCTRSRPPVLWKHIAWTLGGIILMAYSDSSAAERGGTAASRYDVMIERDIPAPMRDGVRLYADVYLPARESRPEPDRFPVILIRTTYDKDKSQKNLDFEFFAKRGYVVVVQDVRGRFKSEGASHYHGVAEENDGYDTIAWIAHQSWCNGKVGMTGISYLAAVQCAAAVANPPALASLFHVKAPSSYYRNGFRHDGTFLGYTVRIGFMLVGSSREGLKDPSIARAVSEPWKMASEWLLRFPPKPGLTPLSLHPGTEHWFFDMLNEVDYTDFWKKVALWEPAARFDSGYKDVPGFYFGGWYDLYREESFYEGLSGKKKGPIRLLMGPWTHMTTDPVSGDVDFGPDAELNYEQYNALQLQWFDATLKGIETELSSQPPVRIFVMGGGDGRRSQAGKMRHGGQWRSERDWPLPGTRFTKYYFRVSHGLAVEQPAREAPSVYTYDPSDPVPTIGGTSYFHSLVRWAGAFEGDWRIPYVPCGPYDQRENPDYYLCRTSLPLSARQDVLVFQTPPLEEAVEVTGPLSAKLWVSSSAVDTDFTAKLIDVYPPNPDYPYGYAMNLSDGILRVRYRDGFTRPVMMQPGNVYPITIDMPPTSNLFEKGHRIRIDVSSSNFPAFDANPNTGDPYYQGRAVKAENRVYHDAERPSHVVLPIIPRRR